MNDGLEDTILSRFEDQVTAFPDKLAIVTEEMSLTYQALNLEANRIAAALASLPSKCDRPVVLFVKSEVSRLAVMIGALKVCRIFIPLAPNAPSGWVSQVIKESGAAHVITDSPLRPFVERAVTNDVTIVDIDHSYRPLKTFVLERKKCPDETTYILYTSGSTGRPKGAAIRNITAIRSHYIRSRLFGIGGTDRFANLRSSGVSSGIVNTLLPLIAGGTLFPFDIQRHGLQKLAPWLIANKITFTSFSGSLLRAWLASLDEGLRIPSLRFVQATGETVFGQDICRLAQHLEGDWRVGHSYSATEAGFVAAQIFTPSRLPDSGVVAVGYPTEGVEVSIRDEGGVPASVGEVGEIVVRSRFTALSYWNDPELTASVLQADPKDSTVRVCRTGDLGRFRDDGMLEYMGRKGRRIRLHGYNIEPVEVESELMRFPGVTEAVALLHKGGKDEASLIGFVVAPEETSPIAIREALAERLPSYMVPAQIVVLDSFPVSSSGKLDRNALLPYQEFDRRSVAFRAPSDDIERDLVEIWKDILAHPNIGIDDDFYDLGGTSLQAFRIFARIAARLSIDLPPATMTQAPTVAKQAELLRRSEDMVIPTLVPLRGKGTLPPLFILHARYGDIGYAREITRDLKSDRPVYGFRPPALDGSYRIPGTLEAIAARYLLDLRKVQPAGPYYLIGHSWGGRLAFEMAQQLTKWGEKVAFLGLIDTHSHTLDEPDTEPSVSRLKRHATAMQRSTIGPYIWKRINNTLIHYANRLRTAVRYSKYDIRTRLGWPIPYLQRTDVYDHYHQGATRRYTVHPYQGSIVIFASYGKSEEQSAAWCEIALGGLKVLEIPAGHIEMVWPPHSKTLAAHLDEELAAQGRLLETRDGW